MKGNGSRKWVAIGIAVIWGIGYLVAIARHDPTPAAAATPIALVAVGWLLGVHRTDE